MRAGHLAVLALAIALGCSIRGGPAAAVPAEPDAAADEFQTLLRTLEATIRQQDSLGALADDATGDLRKVRNEQIWERQAEIEASLIALSQNLREQASAGRDVAEARRTVTRIVERGWPRYRSLTRDSQAEFAALTKERDAATGAQRLAIEERLSDHADGQAGHFRSLVAVILALESAGIDVAEPRRLVNAELTNIADVLVTRLRVMDRERASVAAQVARAPAEAGLRHELSAVEERRSRALENLGVAIDLLHRLGVETGRYKVSRILASGRISADVFDLEVLGGLAQHARNRALDVLAREAPRWLFHALVLVLIFAGFRLLATAVRAVVRKAVTRTHVSQLLRETLIAGSWHLVMGIGFVVILTQLGVEVGALFAGLGLAGFVLGFAMQNTLSNFAAGAMILAYRPFDVGDVIETGNASGTVKTMSLVATTILTVDNQTLIVPNSKLWGDVIRNTTAQSTRRVDLTFSIGYVDDLEKAERVLGEILAENPKVLKDPAPVVRLHQLADGGVNFIVRPWAQRDHYWDVYWEITRAVKQRFDREGISIPAARRDLYVHNVPDRGPGQAP